MKGESLCYGMVWSKAMDGWLSPSKTNKACNLTVCHPVTGTGLLLELMFALPVCPDHTLQHFKFIRFSSSWSALRCWFSGDKRQHHSSIQFNSIQFNSIQSSPFNSNINLKYSMPFQGFESTGFRQCLFLLGDQRMQNP